MRQSRCGERGWLVPILECSVGLVVFLHVPTYTHNHRVRQNGCRERGWLIPTVEWGLGPRCF